MLVFLALNGVEFTYARAERSGMILAVAAGEREYDELLH